MKDYKIPDSAVVLGLGGAWLFALAVVCGSSLAGAASAGDAIIRAVLTVGLAASAVFFLRAAADARYSVDGIGRESLAPRRADALVPAHVKR